MINIISYENGIKLPKAGGQAKLKGGFGLSCSSFIPGNIIKLILQKYQVRHELIVRISFLFFSKEGQCLKFSVVVVMLNLLLKIFLIKSFAITNRLRCFPYVSEISIP